MRAPGQSPTSDLVPHPARCSNFFEHASRRRKFAPQVVIRRELPSFVGDLHYRGRSINGK
jgi:hypothetical protein